MYCTCFPNYTSSHVDLSLHGIYKYGSRGENVRKIQRMLNEVYPETCLNLAEDGIYGRRTEQVVRQFQRDFGRTQDGVVGPNTWTALSYQAGKMRGVHRQMYRR